MAKRAKRKNAPISRDEALRAIYLDFEGRGKSPQGEAPPPVLGGTLVEGAYVDTVVSEELAHAAEGRERAFVPLDDYLDGLIERARGESRRIVYWTSHEAELFEEHGYPPGDVGFDLRLLVKPELPALFKRYKEASREFRSGETKTARARAKRYAFGLCVQCAEHHGFERPGSYGQGLVGKWIRSATKQAHTKKGYAEWSTGAKGAWSRLVNHNEADCRAMAYLADVYVPPCWTVVPAPVCCPERASHSTKDWLPGPRVLA